MNKELEILSCSGKSQLIIIDKGGNYHLTDGKRLKNMLRSNERMKKIKKLFSL